VCVCGEGGRGEGMWLLSAALKHSKASTLCYFGPPMILFLAPNFHPYTELKQNSCDFGLPPFCLTTF
jgi:hypothetical protein